MKIPKAKCEKCKNCELIDGYDYINCKVVESHCTIRKPKRCPNFEKIGGKKCPITN